MRSSALPIAVLLIAGGVACGRRAPDTRLSEDLERDLTAAASSALELANSGAAYVPTRVVSPIEQVARAAPQPRQPRPKPALSRNAAPESQEARAPEPEPQPVVSTPVLDEPEVTQEAAETDVADAPRVPVVAPRPAPVPVDVPSTSGGGSGVVGPGRNPGPDWGDIIGIVIRQGGSDPGHCPPRRRPRGPGIGFPIPYQSPVPVLRPGIHR
jgi:hypothetical protein